MGTAIERGCPAARHLRSRLGRCLLGLTVALLAGCSTGPTGESTPATTGATTASAGVPSPTPTAPPSAATPTPTTRPSHSASIPASAPPVTANPVITAVPASEWTLIVSTGAWHPGCPATQQSLRRVEVNFHGFDGAVHRGTLVVNVDVSSDVARIFTMLFDQGYPIHRMVPIEAYRGDDNLSMAADNTSAYNCRRASQANASPAVSPHANGRAVDVNPWENPWVDDRCHCFQPDAYYGTHRTGPAAIVKGGLVWTAFTSAGWIWQDNASVDYQHFDTGYPSLPR